MNFMSPFENSTGTFDGGSMIRLTKWDRHLNVVFDFGVSISKVLQVDEHFLVHEDLNFVNMAADYRLGDLEGK